jgi:hypothetical protein
MTIMIKSLALGAGFAAMARLLWDAGIQLCAGG